MGRRWSRPVARGRMGEASREAQTLGTGNDNAQAMEAFLADIERRAFRLAMLAVRQRDEALDIVQDAMIGLATRYADKTPEDWRPLFYRILQSRIRDWQRKRMVRRRVMTFTPWASAAVEARTDRIEAAPDATDLRPDREVQGREAMEALDRALAALPERQRQAFWLRTVEGFSVAETAEAMGCGEGSVKTHHHRAVRALRESLGEHWDG